MRAVVYAQTPADLTWAQGSGCAEVILAPKLLSRRGTLSMSETRVLAEACEKLGLRAVLEWDALMTQTHFTTITSELKSGLQVQTLRVRDAGAAQWLKVHYPQARIHLLLEAGHHNLAALRSWQLRLGAQLERVCLSPELTVAVLKTWRQHLGDLEVEVLGLGPLLLFHSGRALLSALDAAPDAEELSAEGASEESPHKGFILQENPHGTLMFHPKDLGLLERWDDLAGAGIDVVRIDDRQQVERNHRDVLREFLLAPTSERAQALKAVWEREWMRGYFDVNKSDVLFPKLKNAHLRSRDGLSLGVVLQGKRDGWLAVLGKGAGLRVGMDVVSVDPKGQSTPQKIHWLKDSGFNPVAELKDNEVGFIAWFAGAPAQTLILRAD